MEKINLGCKTKELWKNSDYRKKMSEAHKGQKAWNKGISINQQMSKETNEQRKIKIGKTLKRKYEKGIMKPFWLGKGKGHYKSRGYRFINLNGRFIQEHHLIWLKVNQLHRLPKGCVIHHINGIRDDNRVENLQLMTNDFHTKLHKLNEK